MVNNDNGVVPDTSSMPPKQPQSMAQNLSEFKQVANQNKENSKSANKKIVLGVLAVLILGLLVAGGAFLLANQNKEESNNNEVGEESKEVAKFDESGFRLVTEECPEVRYPTGDVEPFGEHLEFSLKYNTCAWELAITDGETPESEAGPLPKPEILTFTHKEDPQTSLLIELEPAPGAFGFGVDCTDGEYALVRYNAPELTTALGRYKNEDGTWTYVPDLTEEEIGMETGTPETDYCQTGPFLTRRNFPDPINAADYVFIQSTNLIVPEKYQIFSIIDVTFTGDESLIKDADLILDSMATQEYFATGFGDSSLEVENVEVERMDEPTPSNPEPEKTGEYERESGDIEVVLEPNALGFMLPYQETYKPVDLREVAVPELPSYMAQDSEWYYKYEQVTSTENPDLETTLLVGYSPARGYMYACGHGCFGDSFFIMYSYSNVTNIEEYARETLSFFSDTIEVTDIQVGAFFGKRVEYETPVDNLVEYWFDAGTYTNRIQFFGENPEEVLREVYESISQKF
jgi:hypothetical protein